MSGFEIDRKTLANFDWVLMLLAIVLNLIGLLNLASIDPNGSTWKIQALWFLFGTTACVAGLLIDYKNYLKIATPIFVFCLLFLVGVHFFGKVVNGQRSWYDFGGPTFQPSELMKIAIIIQLSRYYQRMAHSGPWGARELVWPAVIIVLPLASILKEPDRGVALMIVLMATSMLLFAGLKRRLILAGALIGVLSIYPIWQYGLTQNLRDRITILFHLYESEKALKQEGINPELKHQPFNARIAVGSGGLWGMGYKQGTLHRLGFIPAHTTDFVFGIWAEEWGFVWVVVVLGLYLFLLRQGLQAVRQAKDNFGMMLAFGSTILIFWHIFVNLSMVVGIMPIIGVPLPFMSKGGSSTLAFMLAISLILNVRMRRYFF